MHFRTEIDIPYQGFRIRHQESILMIGSCFTENIGQYLQNAKFEVNINPFGILYNPQSISQALNIIQEKRLFSKGDLFQYDGLFHSYQHHGFFSNENAEQCLQKINNNIELASSQLLKTNVLFITFGTAYVYKLKKTGQIVGNCHKMPASEFERYRLDVRTIVNAWMDILKKIKRFNPQIKVIFTVSPIRHLKDGAHENQLSKSILLLAIDELCKLLDDVHYFPSYEIVMDELRDYRFYDEDMIHPNNVAVKYIWERLRNIYFSDETNSVINAWIKLDAAIHHRPFNPDSEGHKHFLKQTLLKVEDFRKKYPYIYCEKEIALLNGLLRGSNEV